MPPKRAKTSVRLPAGRGERQPKSLVDNKPKLEAGEHKPTFSFHYADRVYDGEWSWTSEGDAAELLNFLCDMGRLTWSEILAQQTGGNRRHRKHHQQPFDSVCADAQQRLRELGHADTFEEFFRFRLSGEKRLWGFLVAGVFYVLWWDPNHGVYPTER